MWQINSVFTDKQFEWVSVINDIKFDTVYYTIVERTHFTTYSLQPYYCADHFVLYTDIFQG